MGKEPAAKVERNLKIVEDHRKGMGIVQLVTKYKITPQRIYQIVKSVQTYGSTDSPRSDS